MYKKILVPTDGSDFAKDAQLHALFLAKVSGAEIIALSVSENHFINGISVSEEIEQINQILEDRCKKDLQEFEDMNDEGVKISSVIKEGSPAKTILEVAEEEDIDLIVIGSSGKSGFDRFILGSVSDKVVNAAKCPVLVVH
ncbi:MAG: universal stress protein [Methanobrevibacter sp.]|uniref:Universal stress protein n=1 Tax=Methanobrevibacter millerae TaxID=230361 RepID=A0A8T3VHY7_9EURY|nr:universal stress protein [Methanobrevibacter millerae]MBE6504903.1 universal stress protein [Methanobrevibacter millerae]MBR0058803.1 universal stress protein [Methanobrevibacter sp.]MBR0370719.1 universal stress protein [Methanobrevibacter sp.]